MGVLIQMVALIALPVAIMLDSKIRLGSYKWSWAIGTFLFFALFIGYNVSQYGPQTDFAYALGQMTAVWVFVFGFYRLSNRR